MLIFIDESGDQGFKIKNGSSRFFSMVLVIFDDKNVALACDQRISQLRKELARPDGFEFHFKENSDNVRRAFFKAVVAYNFSYYGIVINKEKFLNEGFENKESFYRYASSLLFENAKDKLRDAIVVIDESGRKMFKYQLATYLKKKVNTKEKIRIKKVKMQDSKGNNLLQLADMVAGALNRSLHTKKTDEYRVMIRTREIHVQMWPK